MKKKAGTSPAILILTFGIVVLMFFALFTFLTIHEANRAKLQSPDILNSAYAKEAEINFQLSQLMKESLNELSEQLTKTSYLNILKENFRKRQIANLFPELKEIESQFTEQNLEIDDDQIALKLNIKIDKIGEINGREVASVLYIYEKKFTTPIPKISALSGFQFSTISTESFGISWIFQSLINILIRKVYFGQMV